MQGPAQSRPKTPHGIKQQARASIQQILNEPFEMLSEAGEQMIAASATAGANTPQPHQPQIDPEEAKKKQARDVRHVQAFQEELKEIRRIQKQREQERAQLRMQEEQMKKQKQEQASQQNRGLLEPVAKIKRGILGGVKGMLRRKQTQVEMQKTPSN